MQGSKSQPGTLPVATYPGKPYLGGNTLIWSASHHVLEPIKKSQPCQRYRYHINYSMRNERGVWFPLVGLRAFIQSNLMMSNKTYEALDTGGPSTRYKRSYFFRSLGLELPTLLSFGKPVRESPKPVFRTSYGAALSDSAVHFIPILACVTALALNVKSIYLGRTLEGQIRSAPVNIAMLQVTSKLVELLVVASLTNIVVFTIRKEMVTGNGVPLGAISGIFMFSSLSYFWSPELWGSFQGRLSLSSKIRIYGVLVVSGLLAATIGPSLAVLLIPRVQDWDAGGSDIYLRGSSGDIWPDDIQFSASGNESICSLANATEYGVCPSSGYLSMLPYRTTAFQLHNYNKLQQNGSSFMFAGTQNYVPSTMEQMPEFWYNGDRRSFACETSVIGVHGATAIYLSQLINDWQRTVMSLSFASLRDSRSQYKYTFGLRAEASSRVPAVRVACSDAQNISAEDTEVEFPLLVDNTCWHSSKKLGIRDLNLVPTNNLTTTWISLPNDFGRVSAGLIFEAPWADEHSRIILGCSVDARWTNATMSCAENRGNPTTAGSPGTACQSSVTHLAPGYDFNHWPQYSTFRPKNDSSWTSIRLQKSWLNILTPTIDAGRYASDRSGRQTTLDSLLFDAVAINDLSQPDLSQTEAWNEMKPESLNRTISLEWILASVVADGLSREGSVSVLNTTQEPASWSLLDYNKTKDFSVQLLRGGKPLEKPVATPMVTKHATILISGYSYKASLFTDYLCISVLTVYMLFASLHLVKVIMRCQVSACWDTITEFLVLMQNSSPANSTLMNTCAGIKELSTYAKVAVIQALQSEHEEKGKTVPHLEVVFREESRKRPVQLRNMSDGSASSRAALLGTQAHSRTWSPSSHDHLIPIGGQRNDRGPSTETDLRRRNVLQQSPVVMDVQMDMLYG